MFPIGRIGSGGHERPIVVLQTVSTDYRQPVWHALREQSKDAIVVVAGARYFAQTIITRHTSETPLVAVRNRYLLGRRLLIQEVPVRRLVAAEVVIAELNPRILTTWLLLFARRFLRRRTVLWGHAFSRREASSTRGWPRQLMRQLASAVVVYTNAERDGLVRRMPGKEIIVAPNAVLSRQEMVARPATDRTLDFIYVGRLVPEKRPDLLVRAFASACTALDSSSQLVIAGTGPLREALEQIVAGVGLENRVTFVGHISEAAQLRALYASALASVSPGYVGLSLTQSLGFGVPMIIADDEPHSPEIDAAKSGFNCVFFRARSEDALAAALVAVSRDAAAWRLKAEAISRACRERYSTEVMAEQLLAACQSDPESRTRV